MSRFVVVVAVVAAVALLCGASASGYRVALEPGHRLGAPEGWVARGLVAGSHPVSLTFALKHANIEQAAIAVSTPGSADFESYKTLPELAELVSPRMESVVAVRNWLEAHGVVDCDATINGDWLVCRTTVSTAETLLNVQYAAFSHAAYPKRIWLRAVNQHYTVPSELADHIDFVGGVHRFPSVKHLKVSANRASMMRSRRAPPASLGVDPHSVRKMYNVSNAYGKSASNSQAVAQFLGQHYSPLDLKEFFTLFDIGIPHSEKIKLVGPDGAIAGMEASLDIEYITAVGANIPTWFWSTPGTHDNQEPFLEWIVAVGNTTNAPWVFSVSYGDDEPSLDTSYMIRIDAEFQKAALRGISLLFASGDSGTECSSDKFTPNFPVSSPWVTAVGGTDGRGADSISGGGFSNVFATPSWQAGTISAYLANPSGNKLPSLKFFNTSGRAYPDVSAQSEGYTVVCNLIPTPGVAGTSCSTPVFSGVVALVNDLRLQKGRKPLGFLNPRIYQTPSMVDDITQDCNFGCDGNVGFCAVPGFDAVTGWGTPNYGKMAAILAA